MLWATCGYFIEKSYIMISAQKEIDFFMEIIINKKNVYSIDHVLLYLRIKKTWHSLELCGKKMDIDQVSAYFQ